MVLNIVDLPPSPIITLEFVPLTVQYSLKFTSEPVLIVKFWYPSVKFAGEKPLPSGVDDQLPSVLS